MSRADLRAAAVTFLRDYATSAGIRMQVYPGRPASIEPPTGFVDLIRETQTDLSTMIYQHNATVEVVVLFGVFDSKESVDQADAFVDGFHDWIRTRFHEAGPNSLITPASFEDEPSFIPEWIRPEIRRTYFGTRVTLEGFATD